MDKGLFNATIKRGSIVITLDRTDLIQVEQTPDGVAFTFKHGAHLIVSDQYMTSETKDLIKAANAFPKGNLIFDLNSYKKPAYVEV